MSLIYINTPDQFQPVLSDGLFFTVSASTYNPSTTYKFRYVYDLYVDGEAVFRGKCTPNPYGLGIIDLQQILESFTFNNPISYWSGTPIYTHTTFPFSRPSSDETISYFLKTGYEYSDTPLGNVTGFTGVGSAVGEPAEPTSMYKTFRSTMGTNGRATQQSFDIGPFVLSGTPIGTYPTTQGLFLTNAPRTLDIAESEYFTLGFTNYFLGGALLSEPYYVKYTFFDDTGVEITGYTYDNIISNGGGPRDNCNYVYPAMYIIDPTSGTTYNTLYVGSGPANIPNFPPNCAQYTVQLFGVFTGSTSPIQPTPSPTPTPSTTPLYLSPTPTRTPTPTPICSTCTEYSVEYTGETQVSVFFVNCENGVTQSFIADSNVVYEVCSCISPYIEEAGLIVSTIGSCLPSSTPTPTPTPSSTPDIPFCTCRTYRLQAFSYEPGYADYIDCEGNPQFVYVPRNGQVQFCACIDSVDYSGTLTDLGSC
jgi:hypothetical protein